jgi:CheY-like chemotaxis protein
MTPAPKILYIEDHPDNRMLVRSVLVPAGYAVLEAADGLSGIEAALRELPAVILLDINLPGIDGYEVVAILRSFPHLAERRRRSWPSPPTPWRATASGRWWPAATGTSRSR